VALDHCVIMRYMLHTLGMNRFSSYLRNLLEIKNIKNVELAEFLGLSESYFSDILAGRKNPLDIPRCELIAKKLALSEKEEEELIMRALEIKYGREDVAKDYYRNYYLQKRTPASAEFVKVPLFKNPPKQSNFQDQEPKGYIPYLATPFASKSYVLIAKDDSMSESGIVKGSYLLVRVDQDPKWRDIVVVEHQGEWCVRHFVEIDEKKIMLIPQSKNPTHEPLLVDRSKINILGVVSL